MNNFNGQTLDPQKTNQILEKFREKHVNDTYPERILMINHLKNLEKRLPVERLRDIVIPKQQNIYMYHERMKNLYLTNANIIFEYIEQLEPWEDVDCIIFDEKLEWYLGINHSEELLLSGICIE
ncbi:hypothetical protein [Oceanirhabdus sp. W0125-5]|uniref:hypothetical protein n=1 Tax=Oceanirhabdus sp. W0125-5 TaxID=2999116 RepID=UPI0022F34286|nr:hypothetical protein [Oceanirhabdus sp. W0125-5]WBW95234.1 hypothetical protein OW730_16240 [Oceanirhabdus sp. W0125-5]